MKHLIYWSAPMSASYRPFELRNLAFCLSLLAFVVAVCATEKGRYVRVENPTGYIMAFGEIEVMSQGRNLALNRPDTIKGTLQPENSESDRSLTWNDYIVSGNNFASRQLTDGIANPAHRAAQWFALFEPKTRVPQINPWFEVDLGREVDIDQIILTGSDWPKGTWYRDGLAYRAISVLDKDRKVVWAKSWRFHDKETYPDGIFRFEIKAQDPEAKGVIGITVPENSHDWIPMTWLLKTEAAPEVPNPKERMEVFAERNSESNLKILADEFFTLLDVKIPELNPAFAAYHAGSYNKAFDIWKTYWFAKMKKENRNMALNFGELSYAGAADDLLAGFRATIAHYGAFAQQFTPGKICWIPLSADENNPVNENFKINGKALTMKEAMAIAGRNVEVGSGWMSLLKGYEEKGEVKYIQKWCEIQDDWTMNYFKDAASVPWEVENMFTFAPGLSWLQLMEDLNRIALKRPEFVNAIDSLTLARIQLRCMEKYITSWERQVRTTAFNHNAGGLNAYYPIVQYIGEFYPGQQAAREWRQAFERWMTTLGTERDGSNTEIGDEGHMEYSFPLSPLLRDIYATQPEWLTLGWKSLSLNWLDGLYFHLIRHLSPGGFDHRDGCSLRLSRLTATDNYNNGREHLVMLNRDKEVFGQPEVQRILAEWGQVGKGQDGVPVPNFPEVKNSILQKQEVFKRHLQGKLPEKPKVLSDWTPYTGEYYFRGGQNSDASFLAMAAYGSHGGSHYGLWFEEQYYGAFWSYNAGYPMLRAHAIKVDQCPPQQMFGRWQTFLPGTKTTAICESEEKPAPHRWLSTSHFDFGEALFHGAFQKAPRSTGENFRPRLSEIPPAIENVDSWRQVIQVRDLHLFITHETVEVPDQNAHEISVNYVVPLISRTQKPGEICRPEQLLLNPALEGSKGASAVSTIKAQNPTDPSVSLYQIASLPVTYQLKGEAKLEQHYSSRLTKNIGVASQEVETRYRGNKVKVINLFTSRNAGEEESVREVQPLNGDHGVLGCTAKFKDGSELWLQVSGKTSQILTCNGIKAKGTLLLVVQNKGVLKGLVLDSSQLEVKAQTCDIPYNNAQFELDADRCVLTPILKPIDPVRFLPDRTIFTDSEMVEMVSDTKGVEIRYTIDGTLPTRTSTLYRGPIKISATTEFTARAFRLDPQGQAMQADDFEINGTKFTIPSFGFFTKAEMKPALNVSPKNLKNGLIREFVQAPWYTLFSKLHWMPIEKTAYVQRELDMDDVKCNESYGLKYKGYIEIPKDGVYTFHAPKEYVKIEHASTYDLRVYIDGEELYLNQMWHARGTWSVALKKGLHHFQVNFADARTTPWKKSGCWNQGIYYPSPWSLYKGQPTEIKCSGPDFTSIRIPAQWLFYSEK